MSGGVLAHKRDAEERLQAWNLKALPDELSQSPPPCRLFIARDGYWRGYFELQPWVTRNPLDDAKPWTLLFDPSSWTDIDPQPAPPKNTRVGYTLDVPAIPQ
jgi:hypothetical protein